MLCYKIRSIGANYILKKSFSFEVGMTKYKTSIQLKSLFLMVVFSINTIIGFACAIGVDMRYNTSHHSEMEISRSNTHSHEHGHGNTLPHHDGHGKTVTHDSHHSEAADAHNDSDKDDCCSDDVVKLLEQEKNIVKASLIDHPVFTNFYLVHFYHTELTFHNSVNRDKKYFVRNHHPPIPDIRIAIQSFQI